MEILTKPESDLRRGARDVLPIMVGYVPFAAVVGASIAAAHDPLPAWLGTGLIYGGAAHLAVLSALDHGVALAVLAGLLVNTRLMVYSATLVGPWRSQPRPWRALAAALLTDAIWALATRRYPEPGDDAGRRRYYLGAAVTLWLGWLAMVSAATLVGRHIALPVDLALAAPLGLLALLGATLRTAGGRVAAGTAALAALFGPGLPGGLGLVLAVAVGTASGLHWDRTS